MPDGRRNGISSDKNSDTVFLCDEEEDEEDEGERLKKSSNLNLFFDLVRAAMDGKIGDRNGNASPRLSTGPRDSDYVMLVLNKNQKENEEIALLIDRLRGNGVTCIFFTRNDLRNGTSKQSSEASEVVKSKQSQSQKASEAFGDEYDHNLAENDSNGFSPSQSPLSASVVSTSTIQVQNKNCNGIITKQISTVSISLDQVNPTTAEVIPPLSATSLTNAKNVDVNSKPLQRILDESVPSCPSPLPPLLSPQVDVKITDTDQPAKDAENDHPQVIPTLNAHNLHENNLSQNDSSKTTPKLPKEPSKKKRRKRRKYPYSIRKSIKKTILKNPIDISEIQDHNNSSSSNNHIVDNLANSKKLNTCNGSATNIVNFSPRDHEDDPYAFTPDDDFEEPPIEPLFSPKKIKKNGLTKDNGSTLINRNKAAVLVKVFGDISRESQNVSPPGRKKIPIDPRAFSPDIVSAIGVIRKTSKTKLNSTPVPVITDTTIVTATKSPVALVRRGRKKRPYRKSKVQKTKKCVQLISKEDKEVRVTVKDEREESVENVEKAKDRVNGCLLAATSISQGQETAVKTETIEVPLDSSVVVLKSTEIEMSTVTETEVQSLLPPLRLNLVESVVAEDAGESVVTDSTNSAQEDPVRKYEPIEKAVIFKLPKPVKPTLKNASEQPEVLEATFMDSMQLRRSSFYSQIAGNVRNNMENHLDGQMEDYKSTKTKRRKRLRNKTGKEDILLHHGDNFPDNPEAGYKLHLATQILLKFNTRQAKCKPKIDKRKSLLSYLQLVPKRKSRAARTSTQPPVEPLVESEKVNSVFSGEWVQKRKFICNVCGHVESDFWDMVTHKGEIHPGIVVTHVELPDMPPEGFRVPPPVPLSSALPPPPPCTKCFASFSNYPDLHRHIFECAGNAAWLEEMKAPRKKKSKRKRGFKRRLSNTPKKKNDNPTKRRKSEVFKCEFCTREFKTEGWLKNHLVTHSLPISIPLNKLTLPLRASFSSSRRSCIQNLIANNKS